MRRLIINADDLGINSQRSHGILQCAEFGVVSSVSIIVNGSDAEGAARRARERSVPAGLHLNLTEDYAISAPEDIPSLVESDGRFRGREKLRQLLDAGAVKAEDIDREIRAQASFLFENYGPPTHIDGHHHIHIHPFVIAPVIALMEQNGIRWVRIPCEEPLPPYGYEVTEDCLTRIRGVNDEANAARTMYAAAGIGSADHFRGMTLVGNASIKNLRHVLARLPEGVTELMVHPGSASAYGTPFDLDPQRQTELRMLTDPSIPEELAARKITLCSYRDL